MDSATAIERPPAAPLPTVVSERLAKKFSRNLKERAIEALLFCAAFVSVFTTVGIVYILVKESVLFFTHVSLWDFLTDTQWTPLFDDAHFGIMVLLSGTITSSLVALLVAIPLGTTIAIYLSEFATPRAREIAKPMLELLSGRADDRLRLLRAALRHADPAGADPVAARLQPAVGGPRHGHHDRPLRRFDLRGRDAGGADVAARRLFAMGATRLQTALKVVVPAAISGIAAAYILGISRAVGETMILAVAAGMQPNLTFNPLEPAATITAYIVQVALGDLPHGSIGYQTIFAAGLTLHAADAVLQPDRLLDAQALPGGVLMAPSPSHSAEIRGLIAQGEALGRDLRRARDHRARHRAC